MLKRSFALLTLLLLSAPAFATPWGDIYGNATAANLKPFALDLGGLLGGAGFHTGRSLGFPGFDVDVLGLAQFKPNRDNTILRASADHAFGLPLVQAAIGLPFNFDVIVHGVSASGARVFGGGLRYGLWKSSMLDPLPDVAISAFGDKVNQTYFNATHYGFNLAASWALPVLHPYAGVGYDITKVTLGSSNTPLLTGTSAWARGARLTGGLDISPLPLVHVFAAYSLRHGNSGADLGLGARF